MQTRALPPVEVTRDECGGRPSAPPRHSYTAEYWRPHSVDDDDKDNGGCGGREYAPQCCSLFQHLRWPMDKGRSPRHSHGESSQHGGRRHSHAASPCQEGRRSRERSRWRSKHHGRPASPSPGSADLVSALSAGSYIASSVTT
jgi:hypothetical protein